MQPNGPGSGIERGPGRHRLARPSGDHAVALRIGRVLVATAAVASVAVSGVGFAVYREATTGLTTSDALDGIANNDPDVNGADTNILLIGLDSRKDMDGNDLPAAFVTDTLHAGDSDVGGYNTNTLLLVHLPAGGGRATVLSIPRDDYVDVPGYGKRKIKEAYGLAKADADTQLLDEGVTDAAERERRAREAGRRSTLTAVRDLLDVPIDHFAEVNLLGFYDVATAVGPIQVCLNNPVHDTYSGADFPAGAQELSATQALSFVRQRHGLDNGDLDRTKRQQAFVAGVMAKLSASGVLANISELRALIAGTKNDIVIDAGLDPIGLAGGAGAVMKGDIDFYTLPITGYDTVDGQDVNLVDVDAIRADAARLIGPAQPAPAALDPTSDPAPPPPLAVAVPEPSQDLPAAPDQGVHSNGGIPCVD
ncbi:LytR family transcriptional regulator [Rhodococcus sp. 05-2254-5]|uniref:LCP family protein n=2 Tax=Rhodococcus TaxID=1827 RepID=UPI000B9AC67A|nr:MULTISPECIES: LCP family protein [unclassified Rhodococcus (in: high G+C Gram-positive bacteria)]OZE33959.1 LytR family transcriptional regulator [Rhodococcus sp. 05-2254-5]OZE63562.1 LytR family transcriptional regulator [Rhodococcus sp. 05-2254-1]